MTEKAKIALDNLAPFTKNDSYSINLLTNELDRQSSNLEMAIDDDSYTKVKSAEKIIVDLCDSINTLRDSYGAL